MKISFFSSQLPNIDLACRFENRHRFPEDSAIMIDRSHDFAFFFQTYISTRRNHLGNEMDRNQQCQSRLISLMTSSEDDSLLVVLLYNVKKWRTCRWLINRTCLLGELRTRQLTSYIMSHLAAKYFWLVNVYPWDCLKREKFSILDFFDDRISVTIIFGNPERKEDFIG